ncbi:MAG: HlyD family secretion protein [Spirochaetia bacterium]|jgi:membrane fusion protein (multidrug efflux system)
MSDLTTPNSRQEAQLEVKTRDSSGGNHRGIQRREEPSVKKKGRRGPIVVGSIVLVVLIGAGLTYGRSWLIDTLTYVSTDDAIIDANHVNISAKMLGRIKSLEAAEGSPVQPGQLLVSLDDTDLRAQETQAAASLTYAKDNLVLAKVNLDKTQDDFQRTNALYTNGATTREQYEHAVKALDTANAQYAIAQAQVDTSNAQLGVIETQLLNTRITAPISGVVATKTLMPGDVVQPGQTIYSINDLSNIWVTANFEETKLSRIRVGAPVLITVDAYSSHVFTGKVSLISAGIVSPPFSIGDFTKTTQRVPIKILFDKPPESVVLLPGMSVEVKIKAN